MDKTKPKKVLVVDDDSTIRTLLKRGLDGYNVIEAENGKDGLEKAVSVNPVVIIFEIMMPEMDGYTVCHRLKSNPVTSGIPVVMMTGLGFEMNSKLALKMGADAYLSKPFSILEMKNTILKLMK